MVAPGTYRVSLSKNVDGVVTPLGEPQSFAVVPLGASSLGLYLYGMVALAVVYGGFLLWCMNQADVQEWLMSRTMKD